MHQCIAKRTYVSVCALTLQMMYWYCDTLIYRWIAMHRSIKCYKDISCWKWWGKAWFYTWEIISLLLDIDHKNAQVSDISYVILLVWRINTPVPCIISSVSSWFLEVFKWHMNTSLVYSFLKKQRASVTEKNECSDDDGETNVHALADTSRGRWIVKFHQCMIKNLFAYLTTLQQVMRAF